MKTRTNLWHGLIITLFLFALPAVQAADGFIAMRVSTPLLASASLGVSLGEADGTYQPTFEAEAGVGGGRILFGLDSFNEGFGMGLKAAYLNTWGEPLDLETNLSYLGAVFQIGYGQFFAEVGGFGRVEGDDDDWLGTVGLGFRL